MWGVKPAVELNEGLLAPLTGTNSTVTLATAKERCDNDYNNENFYAELSYQDSNKTQQQSQCNMMNRTAKHFMQWTKTKALFPQWDPAKAAAYTGYKQS